MVSGAFISAHKCLPSTEFLAPVTFSRKKKKKVGQEVSQGVTLRTAGPVGSGTEVGAPEPARAIHACGSKGHAC